MTTRVKKKDRLNDFLDNNIIINSTSELKDKIKVCRKHNVPYLLGLLVIGSVSTLLLSFIASVMGYGNPSMYFLITLLTNFIAVFINNIIFACFLKQSKKERISPSDISLFVNRIGTQILCSILLSLAQSIVTIALLQITAIVPTLNVVTSILISVVFTLLNALVAFRICDGKKHIKGILPGAGNLLMKNWKALLFISVLFITWSYISNITFSNMLYSQIQQTQGVNNIFHALLQVRDYSNLVKVASFYGMNYLIAGFLEIDILLGLALLYNKDKKACFHEK